MEVFKDFSIDLKNVCIILGFFDGIHAGHRSVINSAIKYANKNNLKTVLLTFPSSPAEYFNKKNVEYIYPRSISYELISKLGVDYIIEKDFSLLVNFSAENYLKSIVNKFHPKAIFTGFNHTFGANRTGTSDFLKKASIELGFEYFSIGETVLGNETVSSTLIKENLKKGIIHKSNQLLENPFILESEVIKGKQLGRKLGFPTANMVYPEKIVKIPYGVYKVEVLEKLAILNWGIKPTIEKNSREILEVHIPNFEANLYGNVLRIKILERIRDEKKFSNLEELKTQIKKDIEVCLKS